MEKVHTTLWQIYFKTICTKFSQNQPRFVEDIDKNVASYFISETRYKNSFTINMKIEIIQV